MDDDEKIGQDIFWREEAKKHSLLLQKESHRYARVQVIFLSGKQAKCLKNCTIFKNTLKQIGEKMKITFLLISENLHELKEPPHMEKKKSSVKQGNSGLKYFKEELPLHMRR